MPAPDASQLREQLAARKRQLHVEAVADVGRQLQVCHKELLAEVSQLKAHCEALARTTAVLVIDASQAIVAGDPPPRSEAQGLTEAARVRDSLALIRWNHEQAMGVLNALLERIGEPPTAMQHDEELARLTQELSETTLLGRTELARRSSDDLLDELPYYGGDPERDRTECLHCGNPLARDRRTYCSEFCKGVHQSVFGQFGRSRA